jgi:hypothetical protein
MEELDLQQNGRFLDLGTDLDPSFKVTARTFHETQ